MFDLLTVVFRDELKVLQVQAQSIDLYCQNVGIQKIYVIVNDDDSIADQIDTNWYGSLKERVTIIPRSQFDFVPGDNGWVSQQVLKILGSALSQNTYTVVLDAKTIFIQDLILQNVIDSNNRLCVGTYQIEEVFQPSRKITNDLFDINLQYVIGPSGVPFYFNNDLIRSMICKIEKQTENKFGDWFQHQGMLTEFILYSGYVLQTYQDFNHVIAPQYYQVTNICHSEVGMFDIKYQRMQADCILTVSIHRNAWDQLTIQQKELYVGFLTNRHITQSKNLL